MQAKGPMKMKKPIKVNFKHTGSQNDGSTIKCSKLVLLRILQMELSRYLLYCNWQCIYTETT